MYTDDDWQRRSDARTNVTKHQDEVYRSDARRDLARLLHSPAFRRLQGKMQLYAGRESDYFRNRLTHSLEVAQVARSIAIRLNATVDELSQEKGGSPLDEDLVEFAGLCHDLGHPPFGHQGEIHLDDLMKDSGGFEGNAQTLRIITRLERKQVMGEYVESAPYGITPEGEDRRLGLNLAARTVASILKYDAVIPLSYADRKPLKSPLKGYYLDDSPVVEWVKQQVAPSPEEDFKTIECRIMDLADDIAYSTYDLEDTFKAEFFGPADMLSDDAMLNRVAEELDISPEDVYSVIFSLFERFIERALDNDGNAFTTALELHQAYRQLQSNGYERLALTSYLIRDALEGIQYEHNSDNPALSKVTLTPEAELQVNVLKQYTFQATIRSSRVEIFDIRAKEILGRIFNELREKPNLLPTDSRAIYDGLDKSQRDRVICDFIAGMTDRYAAEYYGRLMSEDPASIFKPL